jgi:hypothetical protein
MPCYRRHGSGASRRGMRWTRFLVAPYCPVPPLISFPPSGRCSYEVRSNSKIEVCVKISGVVIGRMKVIKSIKLKPLEVAPLKMLLLRVVLRALRPVEQSSCRSSRKLEWHYPKLVCQRVRRSSSSLGFLLMSDGRAQCRE